MKPEYEERMSNHISHLIIRDRKFQNLIENLKHCEHVINLTMEHLMEITAGMGDEKFDFDFAEELVTEASRHLETISRHRDDTMEKVKNTKGLSHLEDFHLELLLFMTMVRMEENSAE